MELDLGKPMGLKEKIAYPASDLSDSVKTMELMETIISGH